MSATPDYYAANRVLDAAGWGEVHGATVEDAVNQACAPLLAEIQRLKVLAVPQWQAIAEKAEAKLQEWANHAAIYHVDCCENFMEEDE